MGLGQMIGIGIVALVGGILGLPQLNKINWKSYLLMALPPPIVIIILEKLLNVPIRQGTVMMIAVSIFLMPTFYCVTFKESKYPALKTLALWIGWAVGIAFMGVSW